MQNTESTNPSFLCNLKKLFNYYIVFYILLKDELDIQKK